MNTAKRRPSQKRARRLMRMPCQTMSLHSFLAVLAARANALISRCRGSRAVELSSAHGTLAGVHFPKMIVRAVGGPLPDWTYLHHLSADPPDIEIIVMRNGERIR